MENGEEKKRRIVAAYTCIMTDLGIKWDDENQRTPERVAKALMELTGNLNRPISALEKQLTLFGNPHGGNGHVIVEDIPFSSLCAHHHMPFLGTAFIKYIPGEQIFGLSKFPRVVEWFSRKPQTQENMVAEIGEFLVKHLKPRSLLVELRNSTHTCMSCRGIRSAGKTTTVFTYEQQET